MQDVVSSKYSFSTFKNIAAVRTLVAESLSVSASSGEWGSGRTCDLVNLISCRGFGLVEWGCC